MSHSKITLLTPLYRISHKPVKTAKASASERSYVSFFCIATAHCIDPSLFRHTAPIPSLTPASTFTQPDIPPRAASLSSLPTAASLISIINSLVLLTTCSGLTCFPSNTYEHKKNDEVQL
ncbi:hypothetical protein RND81_13G102200 [Saponaria officinalis]|uniref:Uncharacterized protein n=1 Tax=Saponaria officinalis TaxID=3572 RepID=A0AAW1GZ61_SAPOF